MLFFVLAIIIAFDQVSKFWIVHHMELYQSTVNIHDFFFITSHRNHGAVFGILQNQQTLLIIVAVIVVVAIIYFMTKMRTETLVTRLGLSFVLGGATTCPTEFEQEKLSISFIFNLAVISFLFLMSLIRRFVRCLFIFVNDIV